MSDAPQPQFFRAIKGSRAERQETVACALVFDPHEPVDVASTRLAWSSLMGGRLREISRAAAETGRPEGKSLPYASLRAALQVQVPDCVMLSSDLGRPWAREDGGSFMQIADGTGGDCAARASGALRTWVGLVLRPWAENLGIDEALVDAVDDAVAPDQAFVADYGQCDLTRSVASGQSFDRLRHHVLQEVSRRLDGAELFPGLGPVYRIVRGRSTGNEVQFQTWPIAAKSGGLYSMVATLALETRPYSDNPALTVRASRRRWLDDIPEPARLRRQRSMTGYLMGRNSAAASRGGPLAVEFAVTVRSGVPDQPCSPEFMHQALSVRADLAQPVAVMAQARGRDVFLGFPYSPQRDGKARVGAGATTRDQVDLLDAVADALAPMGMRPLAFEEQDGKRGPKRSEEYHKALEAEGLVADFAVALGSNELDEEDLVEAARMLMEGAEPPEISPKAALQGRAILETIQSANRARLRRAFGDAAPVIVIVARRESERMLMRAAINGLFGGGIDIAERQLPRDVHGPRQSLPEADKKAKARFAARLEAWRDLSDDLALTYGGCHVLVQADEWYERKHDDAVNKLAGRQALATVGNANVQYLLPAVGGWRGLARYLNRIQAAVYDLMFGHSALVTEVRSLLRLDFPNAATRPQAIIGISLVTQARLRSGGKGGQVCLATRIDAETGRTTARVGWFEAAMRWTDWMPFFDAMKHIASLEAAALGQTEEAKRRSYQAFVTEVVDAAVAADDRPVVMIDSTSAAGLWPWLTDARIGGPVVIMPEAIDKTEAWASARLLRVRAGHAGRVLERKTVRYARLRTEDGAPDGEDARYCPTAVAKTIEVARSPSGPGRHYWITSGYFQSALPRGLSVYRTLESYVPASKVRGLQVPPSMAAKGLLTPISINISDEPYRVPNALDVAVASLSPGDDPGLIAHLVASLRCGYGHSRLSTTLPAPLFFETKARDYMARFALDDMDGDDGEDRLVLTSDDPDSSHVEGGDEPDILEDAAEDEFLGAAEAAEAADIEIADASDESEPADVGGPPDSNVANVAGMASATLASPWSRLLRPSLSVSLVEGTEATGQRVELPFAAKRLPIPGTSDMARRQSAGFANYEDMAARRGAVRSLEARVSDDMKRSDWFTTARDIILPVPSFVTVDWLLSVTAIPGNNHLFRDIYRSRDLIRDLSGFDLPEERPIGRDAAETVIAGLCHANFMGVLVNLAYFSLDKNRRKKFVPFAPLEKRTWRFYWYDEFSNRKPAMRAAPRAPSEVAALLIDAGSRAEALSVVYTNCLLTGWTSDLAAVVKDYDLKELESLMAVLEPFGEQEVRKETVDAVRSWRPAAGSGAACNLSAADLAEPDDAGGDGTMSDVMEFGVSVPEVPVKTGTPGECIGNRQEAENLPNTDEVPGSAAGDELQAAEPFAKHPSPHKDSTPMDDAVSAAQSDWREAMSVAARIAGEAQAVEPDAAALRALVAAARAARAALRAWESAQPRLVDAWPLLERSQAVLGRLASLTQAPATGVVAPDVAEGPFLVDPAMLEEAAALVDDAERKLAQARTSQLNFDAISKSGEAFARFEEMGELKRAAEGAMRTTLDRIGAARAVLLESAARSAAARQRAATPVEPGSHDVDAADSERTPLPHADRLPPEATAARTAPQAETPEVPATPVSPGARQDDAGTDLLEGAEGAAAEPSRIDRDDLSEALADPLDEDPGFELAEADGSGGSGSSGAVEPIDPEPAFANAQSLSSETVLVDPMTAAVATKLVELVTAQAFGAAYHLCRAADVVFPTGANLRFTPDELRLATMSGHLVHVAMQGNPLLERVVNGAVKAVDAITEADVAEDTALARRIILATSCAELAMFHPGLPAVTGAEIIADTTPELAEAFRDLQAAVAQGAWYGLITPAALRMVGQEKADDLYLETCRQAVLANIDGFSKMHFNWVPANRICANLHRRSGVVGEFREKLAVNNEDSIAAARAFAKAYRDRSVIMAVVEKIDIASVVKYRALDGAARERMLSAFEELAGLSAEYVDAADAASAATTSSQKTRVQQIAQSVTSGAEKAIRALAAFAETAPPLPAAAASFGMAALTRLKDASLGRFAPVNIHDHLLAVHGPLLWLPDFNYGSSWLPSPYRPEAIVTALLDMPLPPQSLAPDDDAFRSAVLDRLNEGSFIAARLLIQAGTYYGIDDQGRVGLAEDVEANLSSCRSDLKDSLDDTRRLIDKVQRMGSLVRVDQANAVFAVLDRINPDNLPAEVSLDARGEDEEPEQIMDFGSARDQIEDVRERVSRLLDAPRATLLGRLDALQGRARDGDIARVRELISTYDDLVTAGEYVSFMEESGELPEKPFANRRFHEFFPAVPEALAKLGKHALDDAKAAIETGADMAALPYSRIPAALRGEALDKVTIWRDLRKRVERGDQASAIHPLLDRLFTAARMSPEVLTPAANGPKLPPKTYVAEMRLRIPEDKASLLLPDFGSVVDFNYRIAVAPKLPSEGEMALLCRDAGTYGVIVLVTSVVEAERRRQLQVACLEQNRRVLVIDEAILLYALTEPEFRPLTLIECAQPFSFAAPYKDYGNSPVPREIFFGREIEIRKIVDRMGSCIVYGGRRLGKTALLRHVKGEYSDAQSGGSTAVGYANIRDIGPTPSRVWEAASRDLTAIFSTPVKTGAEFSAKVTAWLKEDRKRRVLLLLDEADHFIEGDSKQQFPEFGRLQELMDSSIRCFKVVLAGLHNVTRIVRTENSPLKQIASDPQRIGPLMDKELPDAERLVTRPMSALGYEFKNRSDIWRILSHCNYYPVLVQTFCAGLLGTLEKAAVRESSAVRRRKTVGEITDRHVREAIENEDIRKEIEDKFAYTIREIDPRYELITCVVAERVLQDTRAGRVDEGMSTVEVLDAVATWWPVAFDHSNRLEIVKDLLDEMVGLGVLRPTASGAWALRSHAILRLLGDEDHVNTRLLSFESRPPPPAFDPRSMRRAMSLPKEPPGYPCPLTWGQEHDLFAGNANISVVFGSRMSDVAYVSDALRIAEPAAVDGAKVTVQVRHLADVTGMLEALRPLARATNHVMLVIDRRSEWDLAWIEAATRQRPVRDGLVRVVFVGAADHALRWVRNPRLAKLPQGVRVMTLQPWADAYLDHVLGDGNLPPERFASELRRITGGFNRPMSWALTGFNGSPDKFARHLKAIESRIGKEHDLLADLGLAPPMADLFARLGEWADSNGRVGLEEIRDGVGDMLQSLDLTPTQVVEFGVMMGLLEPQPARPGDPPESRGFVILPLVKAALMQPQTKIEAA